MSTLPRVVIVGAGFAGLNAAKALAAEPVDVLMIDQHNYHTFQPLLYQVATAGLDAGDVAHQVRGIFRRQANFDFRQGTVVGADFEAHELELASGDRVAYDAVIIAAGAVYDDFGVPGVKQHGFMIKSVSESASLRSHILRQFEMASADPSLIDSGALTFVIVGAGPTGVEMAGALVELRDRVLPRDYRRLDAHRADVVLLEMTDRVLPPFAPGSGRYAERQLRRRGVDIRLNAKVSEARADEVELTSGEIIPTRTLIWAAGVRAHPLAEALGVELVKGKRVAAARDLSAPGHPEVFVAGDLSGAPDPRGNPYPQLAQVAIQQGKQAAHNAVAFLRGEPTERFRYRDPGMMAMVGRNAGIAELARRFGGLKLRGFLGWLGWLFLHLLYLPGFKNRFSTLTSWIYNYLTYDRHARLILDQAPSPGEVADRDQAMASPEQALDAPPARKAAREPRGSGAARREGWQRERGKASASD